MVDKSLEPTLAPFVQPEKPQVFPPHGASFSKSGQFIGLPRAISAIRCTARRNLGGTLMPVSVGFFATI
jgi:hypothetical protein